jgi:hypothetical protein
MVRLQSQAHGMRGQTDPADALPAFEHGVVTNIKADRTSFSIFLRARTSLETRNAALAEYIGRAALG